MIFLTVGKSYISTKFSKNAIHKVRRANLSIWTLFETVVETDLAGDFFDYINAVAAIRSALTINKRCLLGKHKGALEL